MPVVFEKLAEQLREPVFRSAETGYDPLDVRSFLDETAARLAVLEARVAKAEARAERAERKLASARRFVRAAAPGSTPDTGVLDEVVMAGQHQAERIVVDAEAEAVRLREEAKKAAAEARASVDDPELRAHVDEHRVGLRHQLETCHVNQTALETVDHAVRSARAEVLDGLRKELAELAAMPFLFAKEARS
ncbi:MAG: DivIVA protein [Acidimicrobiaceae bacterium]|nr:DivIVA protein [Acidimicrobiaceae bacterium]